MPTPAPLLTIAIPTYRRLPYLRELLQLLLAQLQSRDWEGGIEVLVVDNASPDGTAEYLATLKAPGFSFRRNPANIGGDANFVECVRRSAGEYVWLLGDDELLEPDALALVHARASAREHALLILSSSGYDARLGGQTRFHDYRGLVAAAGEANPHFLLAHTLISANVFRRGAFDLDEAARLEKTSYGHMYGLLRGLSGGGSIYCFDRPVLKIRPQRAAFEVPPSNLLWKQGRYLGRVAAVYGDRRVAAYARRWMRRAFVSTVTQGLRRAGRPAKRLWERLAKKGR